LFTEQIAGIAMVFILIKLNDGFTIGKTKHFKALAKNNNTSAIAESRPLDITSSGIVLILFSEG